MKVDMVDVTMIAQSDLDMDDKNIKILLDSNNISSIHGNGNKIRITFSNLMGNLYISIIDGAENEAEYDLPEDIPHVRQDEMCQFIKDRLGKSSKFTLEDIDLILDMELEYLRSVGIAD